MKAMLVMEVFPSPTRAGEPRIRRDKERMLLLLLLLLLLLPPMRGRGGEMHATYPWE